MPRWFQNYSNRFVFLPIDIIYRNGAWGMIYTPSTNYCSVMSRWSIDTRVHDRWSVNLVKNFANDTVPARKFRIGTNYRFRTEINYIEVDVYYTGFIVPLIYNLRERVAEGVRVARDVTSSRSFRLMPDEKISRESNFTRRGKRGKENQLGVGQSPAGQ